ncbi:MAG: hypothetical protein KF760_34650 [Candidatus Eremiobacteraeota bacterium]|nr:hypothetical protein [Candidatus Eremiobacteraeota bacterium]MCW5868406.1 hypothetical protein [Candidatus Eremiobacteraeota bacterium]
MANNTVITNPLAYSFGLVVAGYLIVVLPCWGVSVLWNRLMPTRIINPWILPNLGWLFLGLCFAIQYFQGKGDIDDPMVITAFLPAALGCPLAAWRWRPPDPVEETLGVNRD